MAKKVRRVRVPSVADMMSREGIGSGGTRYENSIITAQVQHNGKTSNTGPQGIGLAARARAARDMNYETALAIQAAKEGDDSELLPYQPTPSINPPRPRTLAAGYDPRAKVMRVRFRDGVGYEYYDVSPTEWRNFKRVKSPGRAINRTFNYHPYARADW